MKRRPLGEVASERPSALGGWLYADIFLALMVVGLATVTVKGESASATTPTTTTVSAVATTAPPSETTTTTIPLDRLPSYLGSLWGDGQRFRDSTGGTMTEQIASGLAMRGWSDGSIVVVAYVKGGYDPSREGPSDGTRRASGFFESFMKNHPYFVPETSPIVSGDKSLAPSEYEVKLYFAFLGDAP